MTFPPRVVITGPEGVVVSETDVISRRAGHRSTVVWATESVPAELVSGPSDVSDRSLPGGTVFRITEFSPGVASDPHETDSVDYAVVLSGEIELELGDDTVALHAGDVLVQRGTAHNWVNNGSEPCVVAFCLVGATR